MTRSQRKHHFPSLMATLSVPLDRLRISERASERSTVINVESDRAEVTFSNPVHNPRWVLVCPALPRSNPSRLLTKSLSKVRKKVRKSQRTSTCTTEKKDLKYLLSVAPSTIELPCCNGRGFCYSLYYAPGIARVSRVRRAAARDRSPYRASSCAAATSSRECSDARLPRLERHTNIFPVASPRRLPVDLGSRERRDAQADRRGGSAPGTRPRTRSTDRVAPA